MSATPGFADLVGDSALLLDAEYGSKDSLLAGLAAAGARLTGLPASLVLERLRTREALGSTGFGQGAAIPHARLDGLPGVRVVVARLAQPIEFEAIDGEPVDIAVLLLSPEAAGADHLKALARISRVLRDPFALQAMRDAGDIDAMRLAIGGGHTGQRAA